MSDQVTSAGRVRAPRLPPEGIDIRPYEVRIDGARKGRFEDLRDAIASGRIAKRSQPIAHVVVADVATGQLVIECDL